MRNFISEVHNVIIPFQNKISMITSIYTNSIQKDKVTALDNDKDIPKKVYVRSSDSLPINLPLSKETKILCVIGSRHNTQYGKEVTQFLISGLSQYNIAIISGLAYGIDSIAHQSALENNMLTLAFPGSGLNDNALYPKVHVNLAHSIVNRGGYVVSEFGPNERSQPWMFIKRNILMASLCDAVLVIESKEHSGTSITAKAALDFGKDVMVVPGSIFSEHTKGVHDLLSSGATPVMCAQDIIEILKPEKLGSTTADANADASADALISETNISNQPILTAEEKLIIHYLDEPKSLDELVVATKFPISKLNVYISLLEINKRILFINGKIVKIFLKNTS